MEKETRKGFDIEMEFSPALFLEKGQRNSFYDDAPATEKIVASGSFRIPPFPNDK